MEKQTCGKNVCCSLKLPLEDNSRGDHVQELEKSDFSPLRFVTSTPYHK